MFRGTPIRRPATRASWKYRLVSKGRVTALAAVIGLVLVAALAAWIALGGVLSGASDMRRRIAPLGVTVVVPDGWHRERGAGTPAPGFFWIHTRYVSEEESPVALTWGRDASTDDLHDAYLLVGSLRQG